MRIIIKYTKSIIYQLTLIFLLNSCLEDINDPLSLKFDNSSDLITYVEARTTILKGEDQPVLVDVDELNQNLGRYLVLDIRTQDLFESGHVPGAINVQKSEMLNYINSISSYEYDKIVIVSNTGQVASYVACLLKIAGYDNVYLLDRGMTYWASAFSDELSNARGIGDYYYGYGDMPAIKPPKSNTTPSVSYTGNPGNTEEKVSDRITALLKMEDELLFVSAEEFSDSYNNRKKIYEGYFVVYTLPDSALHRIRPPGGQPRVVFGPKSMIFYDTPWTFTSSNDLLTLPLYNNILLYSPNGQRASFFQAYLHFIGFTSTKTIKYGAIAIMDKKFMNVILIYDSKGELIDTIYVPTNLTPYGFWEDEIRNYSFDTGP